MNKKTNFTSTLYLLSWVLFVANICFCFSPFVTHGSISFDNSILYGIKYGRYMVSSLVSVSFMCFSVGLKNASAFGSVCSWIWSFFCCFGVATIRYTQMGFNYSSATRTWRFFGILLTIFILTLVSSSKIGAAVRTSTNMGQPKMKQKFRAFDVIALLLLIGIVALGTLLILHMGEYYSLILHNRTIVTIGVLAVPVVAFITFAISWKGNEIVGSWFCVSMAVLFECIALRLKTMGSNNPTLFWILLAATALVISIYMKSRVKNIVSQITALSIIAIYIILLLIETPMITSFSNAAGEGTNWWVIGPIILDIILAYTVSLFDLLKKHDSN